MFAKFHLFHGSLHQDTETQIENLAKININLVATFCNRNCPLSGVTEEVYNKCKTLNCQPKTTQSLNAQIDMALINMIESSLNLC